MTKRLDTPSRRLEAWKRELETNKHGLAWFAPTAIARLQRPIIPWAEGFGTVIAKDAKITDWGKIP